MNATPDFFKIGLALLVIFGTIGLSFLIYSLIFGPKKGGVRENDPKTNLKHYRKVLTDPANQEFLKNLVKNGGERVKDMVDKIWYCINHTNWEEIEPGKVASIKAATEDLEYLISKFQTNEGRQKNG